MQKTTIALTGVIVGLLIAFLVSDLDLPSSYAQTSQEASYGEERALIERILSRPSEPHTLWNINLPCLSPDEADPDVVECPLDLSPLPLQFRQEPTGLHYSGSYSKRARRPGADIDVCFSGRIAVTRISLIG